jgi:hypothetical protein
MRSEQCEPISSLSLSKTVSEFDQTVALFKNLSIGASGAARVPPFRRADQNDQALLRRVDHMDESLLEHGVAPISRQERKDISVWNDSLH